MTGAQKFAPLPCFISILPHSNHSPLSFNRFAEAAGGEDGEEEATAKEIDEESGPEGGVGGKGDGDCRARNMDEADAEKDECRDKGDLEHGARGSEAYEEAVEYEGAYRDRRDQHYEPVEREGVVDYILPVGDEADYVGVAECVDDKESYGNGSCPQQDTAYAFAEHLEVGGSCKTTHKCFAGEGQTIHEIGEKQEELHQHGIGGKLDIAKTRSDGGDGQRHRHDAGRAEENIGVDIEESPEILASHQLLKRNAYHAT